MTYTTQSSYDRVAAYADRVFEVPEGMARMEYALPSDFIPFHYHPEDARLEVLSGDATVVIDGHPKHLRTGQRLNIPAERFHSTYFGRHGCSYRLVRLTHKVWPYRKEVSTCV